MKALFSFMLEVKRLFMKMSLVGKVVSNIAYQNCSSEVRSYNAQNQSSNQALRRIGPIYAPTSLAVMPHTVTEVLNLRHYTGRDLGLDNLIWCSAKIFCRCNERPNLASVVRRTRTATTLPAGGGYCPRPPSHYINF